MKINYNIVLRNIIIILIIALIIIAVKFNWIQEDINTSYNDYIQYHNLADTEQSHKQYLEYIKNKEVK